MKPLSTQDSRESNQNDPVAKIHRILGEGAVLIAVRRLTKKPLIGAWQKVTREAMNKYPYLESLKGKNIGVLLGRASGGLCTIDLDSDSHVEPFLDANPRLRETTQTKRVRGCNIWVYVEGDYPPYTELRAGGKTLGEWRVDGHQTVIFGSTIDRGKGETTATEYKFLNEAPPIRIRFDEIVFPKDCFETPPTTTPPLRLNPASCMAASLHPCIPASLHNKADEVLENIKAEGEARASLKAKYPNLDRLYSKLVERRFQARQGARNAFIVQAVPFLYRAVAPQFVLELVACFYDCNRALFNDPRERHMSEAEAMLESVAHTYIGSLDEGERKTYGALPADQLRDAFRILRDLANLKKPDRPQLTFFMSFAELGDRLGIHAMQAQRIMSKLEGYGLVTLLQKGTRRAPGAAGMAGEYRWQLGALLTAT